MVIVPVLTGKSWRQGNRLDVRYNRSVVVSLVIALASAIPALADLPPRVLPGLQPDGSTLLHNQWPIRPVGRQVPLGDFPVNLAVDPSGRYAAILHAGYGPHAIHVVDLQTERTTAAVRVHETFCGLVFSPDGRRLYCSGGGDAVLHVFAFADGQLTPLPDVPVAPKDDIGVVAGIALARRGRTAIVARPFDNQILSIDATTGARGWATILGDGPDVLAFRFDPVANADLAVPGVKPGLVKGDEPLNVVSDPRHGRIYASLWGKSAVAVLDANDGRLLAHWPCGLHPNELLLSRDGRLFISNGGLNTVTVLAAADGRPLETLSTAMTPLDLPGSTPNSLALSHDGRTLYVANGYNNNVAVFDVSVSGQGRPLGFIPTGWFPTCVRLTPDDRKLLVVSARGLVPKADSSGSATKWPHIGTLYRGSLGIVDLPRGDDFERALAAWTHTAESCRPAPAVETPADQPNPIPDHPGGGTPIRYVIYVIKENRTYDQVLGDLPQGNGDPALCLFPEKVTPNIHAIARQFVLLDNFYANAEISASGHEWSMAGYSSEFVEKVWPPEYGHRGSNLTYPAEGTHAAAAPDLGYLWDRAAAAGIPYRSSGEFAVLGQFPPEPVTSNLPALRDHIDPHYRGWDLTYHDVNRAARFISELHRFERVGDMPRLQIVRLPEDHTAGAKLGSWTPAAMVADNDVALGRLVEAVSHSIFWSQTAIFIVEDDSQSGPDHVDAHRTEALVVSAYTRRRAVDSTPYTTCSMLRSIELILGLPPMSQFDAAARPMWASFQAKRDLMPYYAMPAQIDIEERNVRKTQAAKISASFDFSREDANDDQVFNQVIWQTVRGDHDPMPAPVHAAFVRSLAPKDDDDDDD